VYRHVSATWDEPSPKERERAMGFQTNITSHTKVIRLEHNVLLGKGMDLNSFTWLLVRTKKLPHTSRGNVYIMIMIEHFSKWVELVALPDKSSHNTNQAFLQQVLSRFGACVECLTDQGSKFRGEFQDLLDHAFIDHRRTSRDHPQVDGLVERMV
jgi:hypothetical protein